MRFKVGDKVLTQSRDWFLKTYPDGVPNVAPGFNSTMSKTVSSQSIGSIIDAYDTMYTVVFPEGKYTWLGKWLVPVNNILNTKLQSGGNI